VARLKSIVIIDGSNFYHKLKEIKLPRIFAFDFSSFALSVAKRTRVTAYYYCVGKIQAKQEDKKARLMMAKQQSLVTKLQKEGFIIQFGYLLKSNNKYHEKGVDVQIATNILKGAFKNSYDIAFLISSDSDLIPAITEAQTTGKTIFYVGFAHKPSLALLRTCKKSKLLKRDDLLHFTPKKR
jgi:uncharacterized LabA/DUF88 family protein